MVVAEKDLAALNYRKALWHAARERGPQTPHGVHGSSQPRSNRLKKNDRVTSLVVHEWCLELRIDWFHNWLTWAHDKQIFISLIALSFTR